METHAVVADTIGVDPRQHAGHGRADLRNYQRRKHGVRGDSPGDNATRPPEIRPSEITVAASAGVPASKLAAIAVISILVLIAACVVLMNGLPRMDPTANALRPRSSPAYAALDQIKLHLNEKREPLWLIISSKTEKDMAQKLDELQPILTDAVSNNLIGGF